MDKAKEILTLDSKDIAKPIIELSKSQPLKSSSFSIFSFFKYFSCTSSKPTVINTQSLGDAIAQATLELQTEPEPEPEPEPEKETESIIGKAALAVVEQAEVLKQVQEQALNQLDMKAQSKEDIMDPTTIELLIKVTDGVRVVTEKEKEKEEENKKMDELTE
jgi:hypothetical protein